MAETRTITSDAYIYATETETIQSNAEVVYRDTDTIESDSHIYKTNTNIIQSDAHISAQAIPKKIQPIMKNAETPPQTGGQGDGEFRVL